MIAAAQVLVVGVGLDRRAFLQALPLLTGELQPQCLGDLPRDLLLHRHQVADLLPELFAPQL